MKGDKTMADIAEKLADLSKKAVKLRDKDGLPWHEIAGELGTSSGKALLAYEFGKVAPGDRVTAKNEAELGKKVAQLRDRDGLSWGRIQARTGMGEQTLRRLYTEATGKDTLGHRIGKGGRYPGSTNGKSPTKRTAAAKKAPAKKAVAAKKAPAVKKATAAKKASGVKKAGGAKKAGGRKSSGTPSGRTTTSAGTKALVDMTGDELKERLTGKRIQVQVADTDRRNTHVVKVVRGYDAKSGNLDFIDNATGNVRTVKVSAIKVASK